LNRASGQPSQDENLNLSEGKVLLQEASLSLLLFDSFIQHYWYQIRLGCSVDKSGRLAMLASISSISRLYNTYAVRVVSNS
jgi:hypothetical protein